MKFLKLHCLVVILVIWVAAPSGPNTLAADGNLQAGTLPAHWIDGTDCNTEAAVQVHAYNEDLFILRQSLCTNFEAPFIYIFGEDRVLMQDTGAGSISIRTIVDDLIAQWLEAHGQTATFLHTGYRISWAHFLV